MKTKKKETKAKALIHKADQGLLFATTKDGKLLLQCLNCNIVFETQCMMFPFQPETKEMGTSEKAVVIIPSLT